MDYIGCKVKMELIQPEIKCSGRDTVSCYYKGKVIDTFDSPNMIQIKFKYKGETIHEWYNLDNQRFNRNELSDIKIIKISGGNAKGDKGTRPASLG